MDQQGKEEGGPIIIQWDGGPVDGIIIMRDIIAYILFMHHQIPLPLDQLEMSADENIVEITNCEVPSLPRERREKLSRMRIVKRELKRRTKLVQNIQTLLSALQTASQELSYMPSLLLVLGSSSKQPHAAYEIQFHGASNSHLLAQTEEIQDLGKSYSKETISKRLSKKVIRTLITEDDGPLITDAASCLQDFVPNRFFTTESRKIQACLRVIQISETSSLQKPQIAGPCRNEGTSCNSDVIWFQCKSKVKGGQCRDEDME
ncbi:hypothetical protein KP509_23G057200 [Ceratopteris richardii]|uniref:Uncharacterized protein n=2 Tax=Ceratopteris richardii TaxID=49495 RepID=A0A8T2S390_CERRI|nr:hypothetical protein KP509_23G057200 [Ceratopteris richardii]